MALTVLVVGLAGSVAVGVRWTQSAEKLDRQSFQAAATGISGAVTTALRRNVDLVATARTFVGLNPSVDNAGLRLWFNSLGAAERYPGALGVIYVQRVQRSGLAAFRRVVKNDPAPVSIDMPFQLMPAGDRSEYCLLRLSVVPQVATTPGSSTVFPPGLDLCQVPGVKRELDADGRTDYFGVVPASVAAAAIPANAVLTGATAQVARSAFIAAPVYRDGTLPATAVAGQQSVLGWVTAWFDAGAVVADATRSERRLTVTVAHADGTNPPMVLTQRDGTHPKGHLSRVVVDADGRWTITVAGSLNGAASPAFQGWILSIGGAVATLLLVGIILLLGSGRTRAMMLAHRRTAQMRHQALHDALTGLPNRALIMDRANQMLNRARHSQTQVAALFIDLDDFKDINDTLGHSAGDELLQAVAQRLTRALRQSDTVGRLGGDEFVVLTDGPSLLAGPELVAQRVAEVLHEPFELAASDTPYEITASVGLAVGVYDSAEDLLRNADVALYEAKAAGKDTYALFEEQMQHDVNSRLALEVDLRDALKNDQFFLVYQPTFEIADLKMLGVEALVRWRHPVKGVVRPDEFIPFLESNGMIVAVGRWVLQEACRKAAEWARNGRPIAMAVNVSTRQLVTDDFVADVRAALDESGLDAQLLTLEITEATLMTDTTAAVARLEELKAIGVRLAIDDFGTGYSSLAYLRQFPVDILKIDRMFVEALAESHESTVLVHSLVQLGKTLGLQVVAEGIEEVHQLRRLQEDNCDVGQGYLYSRPLTGEQLAEFVATKTESRTS
ncbi:MAG TPA: EAL domain-containing protein [Mycobacterium sp.]|nr:EAL domain-containing protein [Mycobacterium sp.]